MLPGVVNAKAVAFFHGFRSYSLANCIAYFPEKAAMKYMTNAQLQEFYIDIHKQCT